MANIVTKKIIAFCQFVNMDFKCCIECICLHDSIDSKDLWQRKTCFILSFRRRRSQNTLWDNYKSVKKVTKAKNTMKEKAIAAHTCMYKQYVVHSSMPTEYTHAHKQAHAHRRRIGNNTNNVANGWERRIQTIVAFFSVKVQKPLFAFFLSSHPLFVVLLCLN